MLKCSVVWLLALVVHRGVFAFATVFFSDNRLMATHNNTAAAGCETIHSASVCANLLPYSSVFVGNISSALRKKNFVTLVLSQIHAKPRMNSAQAAQY